MTIKDVENKLGITKANIRYYENEGLISPKRNDTNNYREYSEQDIEQLERIKVLRVLGVPISDIRELKDGRLEGLEAFVQAQREADPGAFDSERRLPRFVAPAGLAGRPADHVAQARAMGAERAAAMRSSGEILKNFL